MIKDLYWRIKRGYPEKTWNAFYMHMTKHAGNRKSILRHMPFFMYRYYRNRISYKPNVRRSK